MSSISLLFHREQIVAPFHCKSRMKTNSDFYTPLTKVLHRLLKNGSHSDFYQKYKLQSLLLITFRSLDIEIGGNIQREVLMTFF